MNDLVAAFSGTMAALKAVTEAAQGVITLRQGRVLREGLEQLQTKLLAAQLAAMTAQDDRAAAIQRVSDLEKQLVQAEAWNAEKQRYELKAVSPGAFAYALKPGSENGEPPHWLCARCYNESKKAILQESGTPTAAADRSKKLWVCPVCRADIRVPMMVKPHGHTGALS